MHSKLNESYFLSRKWQNCVQKDIMWNSSGFPRMERMKGIGKTAGIMMEGMHKFIYFKF